MYQFRQHRRRSGLAEPKQNHGLIWSILIQVIVCFHQPSDIGQSLSL
jgi:hypothetical protein